MTYRVLIPDGLDSEAVDMLENAGIAVISPSGNGRDEVLKAIDGVDALIIRSATRADFELLQAGSNLKLVVRAGVGVDNVDFSAATAAGIVVENTPGSNTISTAELTIGLIIACARNIPASHLSLSSGNWDRKHFVGREIRGKTLGLIGFGRVGRAVAQRAMAFGMLVMAYDPLLNPSSEDIPVGVNLVTLEELLSTADIISLHTGLNDETRGMINRKTIALMKDGVILINTARGAIFDASDVADAVNTGKVASVGVDVFDIEPPPSGHPLIGLAGVIHTPHLGANTIDAQKAVGIDAASQVIAGLIENEFRNVVNPEVFS